MEVYTYQQQLIPIPSSPTPISLDSDISITFNTTGFTYNQQFLFQTKITALVDTDFTISTPIYIKFITTLLFIY